jgi:uncharacterized protein
MSDELLRPQAQGIPVPVPGPHSGPYWDGCREGELRFQRCEVCGTIPARPSDLCPRCHTRTLRWQAGNGNGSLYSWTVVWRPQRPAFAVPYAPAIIELDEGYRWMSAMVGCAPGDLRADMRVGVEFHPVSDTITLPYFHPAGP